MARLPRLAVPGEAHYVIQRGIGGITLFAGAGDRADYLAALREAARAEHVVIHAYALLDSEVQWLATPGEAAALGRVAQAVGRRYVSAYNRSNARRGTLWDGRFRCAVIEPGAARLAALLLVDGQAPESGATSAAHRLGVARDPTLSDPPEFWALGNTPFEREAAYRELLHQGVPAHQAAALRGAVLGGWAAGSTAFAAHVATTTGRPAQPRPRGRPRSTRG